MKSKKSKNSKTNLLPVGMLILSLLGGGGLILTGEAIAGLAQRISASPSTLSLVFARELEQVRRRSF